MKNCYKLISVFSLMLISQSIFSQTKPFGDSLWTLVFSDEFSGTSVDGSKWLSQWPSGQVSTYTYINWNASNKVDTVSNEKNQFAYVTPGFANVPVSSGTAKIISKKENYLGKCWDRWIWADCWGDTAKEYCPIDTFVWFKYTTGNLYSKATFKYGYFETRIKLPDHFTTNDLKGLGPAFYLFGGAGPSLLNWSELDIFEFAGKDQLDGMYNKLTSNVHYQHCSPSFSTVPGCNTTKDITHFYDLYQSASPIVFSNQFHKIAMDWRPDRIDFYLDDVLYHHVDSLKFSLTYGAGVNPSRFMAMPMIMGISHPTTNFATYIDTINTVFPYNFEIDYVRVWQYNQHCDSTLNVCAFNAGTYDPAIYKQVNAGSPSAGTGCTPTISSGQNISFIGKNYVLLEEGFNVQSGAQFLGDSKECTDFFENARTGPPNMLPSPPPAILYQRISLKKP